MKNSIKVVGAVIAMAVVGTSAYAAMEQAEVAAPLKTLADFKAEYAGTKPVVAVNKYWEYMALQKMPKPTLAVTAIREEQGQVLATGTKPVVGALKRLEGKR